MNPLVSSFIGALVRWLLAGIAGYLVQHCVITGEQSQMYVAAAVVGAPALLWSLWEKYRGKLLLHTAIMSPPSTVTELKEMANESSTSRNLAVAFAPKSEVEGDAPRG